VFLGLKKNTKKHFSHLGYLAVQAPTYQAGMTFGTSSIGFDPADSA